MARRQFRRGVARVAVEREVVCARRLAHHDHQQRRPGLGRVAGPQRGAGRDRQQLAAAHEQRPQRHVGGGVQRRGRVHHVAQLRVVAHQRRQFALHRQRSAAAQRQRRQQQQRVAPELRPQVHPRNPRTGQPQCRQRHHAQHVHHQAPAEQVARFVGVGLQHVGHHGRVHDDAVAEHVVLDKRGDQHDAQPQRLHPARPGGQRQHRQRGGEHQHRHRRDLGQVDAGRPADARQLKPQGPVGRHREVEAQPQHDGACGTGLAQHAVYAAQPAGLRCERVGGMLARCRRGPFVKCRKGPYPCHRLMIRRLT